MDVDNSRMLQFERPIVELESRVDELRSGSPQDHQGEIERLEHRIAELEERIYRNLSPWEQVQLARHQDRPTTQDYISRICDEFIELHGDRLFSDDAAVIGGLAWIDRTRVVIIGHEKGATTKERLKRNFGMARPEGFRKALRLMRMAEKFALPIVSFIDTPGAYPGVGAEERGQPEAIARNLKEVFNVRTPILVVVIGEGGSGGALAIAIGDRVLMMEHAVYSVISPEGCAAILWKSKDRAPDAASSLRLTAADCLELGVVDTVIEEIHGAAHRDPEGNAAQLKGIILTELAHLQASSIDLLMRRREDKYFSIGVFESDES
jgi:acetyl-CoA carboxylase carboxyl transferase subunit alpha